MMLALAGQAAGVGGQDGPCPERHEGEYAYAEPRMIQPIAPLSTRLVPGATVATEVQAVGVALLETDRAIDVAAPLVARFPAGTRMGGRLVEGELRPCVYWGREPFQPPVDEEGRPFPTICLHDADEDGAYETIRFFAYRAAPGRGVLEAAIDPVRLLPRPEDSMLLAFRRLRVIAVSRDRVRLATEHAVTFDEDAEPSYHSTPAGEIEFALREGSLAIAGITLEALHLGRHWTVTPSGRFPDWIRFECQGARLEVGGPESLPDPQ